MAIIAKKWNKICSHHGDRMEIAPEIHSQFSSNFVDFFIPQNHNQAVEFVELFFLWAILPKLGDLSRSIAVHTNILWDKKSQQKLELTSDWTH